MEGVFLSEIVNGKLRVEYCIFHASRKFCWSFNGCFRYDNDDDEERCALHNQDFINNKQNILVLHISF